MGKKLHGGPLPKAMKPYKDNISARQKLILSRYLGLIDEESTKDARFLLTDKGQKGVDVAMKLELKEQQIIAQKELGAPQNNSLLLILNEADKRGLIDVTPKAKEIDRIDKIKPSKLDRECIDSIDV